MNKINRRKKFLKVFAKKYSKPIFYAVGISFAIYLIVGNIAFQKKLEDYDKPHFVISRISQDFDDVEFMHLLLTIQELNKDILLRKELISFVNEGFPNPCPRELNDELYKMNWYSQAFLVRVKKMFKMYDIYDRSLRIEDTIQFLRDQGDLNSKDPHIQQQVLMFIDEKNRVITEGLSKKEYDFVKEYSGIILDIKR